MSDKVKRGLVFTGAVIIVLLLSILALQGEEKGKTPLTITADKMEIDYGENRVLFQGKVLLKDSGSQIKAGKILLYFEEKGGKVSRLVASGEVEFSHSQWRALCGKATLYYDEDKVVLQDNPRLWYREGFFKSSNITIFLKEDRLIMDKGVEGIIRLGEEK